MYLIVLLFFLQPSDKNAVQDDDKDSDENDDGNDDENDVDDAAISVSYENQIGVSLIIYIFVYISFST